MSAPKYVTDAEAQEIVEAAYDVTEGALPDNWTVSIVAIDPNGRSFIASDAPDMDEVARRVASWGEKMLVTDDEGRALPPKEARH